MKNINIGKITEFSNFGNSNDGISFYKKNKVSKIYHEFIENGTSVWCAVLSEKNITHKTKVSLDKDDCLTDFNCSCSYKSRINDACKHIVASYLFYLNELKNSLNKLTEYDFSSLDTMTNSSDMFLTDIDNSYTYTLNYTLFIESTNNIKLELKIVLNKLYTISNIEKFLDCIVSNTPYSINKNLKIKISKDSFSKNDKKLINELLTIYSLKTINTPIINYIFFNQYIVLNEKLLDTFFETINGDTFNINILDNYYENCLLLNDDIDIAPIISLNESNNLTLSLNIENLINLFPNSPYFYFEKNIYKCSVSTLHSFNMLKNIVLKNNTSHFIIDNSNKNNFLNKTLPKLSKHFNLKICKSLSENLDIKSCKTKFYIDKTQNDFIIIKVIFSYESTDINPLDENILNLSIIRDYETENKILKILNKYTEVQNSLYFFIKSAEKIIDLKEHGLKELKELGEIYYTKNFKKYKFLNSSTYSTSFNLGIDNLLNVSFSFNGLDKDELYSAIKKIRKGEKYLKLKNKGILDLDNDYLKNIDKMLFDLNISEDTLKQDNIKINKHFAFYLNEKYSKNFDSIGSFEKNSNFSKLINSINFNSSIDLSLPNNLNASLRNYQLDGFKWFKTLKEYGLSGILADEMGLGKTLQTITFLQKEKEDNALLNSIVICPKSLIYNWCEEIKKFAPSLKTLIYNGNKNIRLKLLEDFSNYDLIITSYGIVKKDIEYLKNINFNICILDEAQNIKNKISKNTTSLKELNVNYKFALTGTPIENSIDELWSIFDFLMPGYLFSYNKFKSLYELPSENNEDQLKNLRQKISPFILRRLKENVLKELPPKIETKIIVDLNEEQKKLYYSYVEKFKNEFTTSISNNEHQNLKFKMLSALTRLRQICCEPKIILEDYSFGSSKIDALMELIETHSKNKKKIIVFSNFTTVLNIIRKILIERNINYKYLDGSTPSKERLDIVKKFNENDDTVFLISLKAGGFGLNITSAEIVIHFDPWWNNAVENQATDRAHRIGQKNTLHVIKLITKGTIEEKIFEIQERKNELINNVINSTDSTQNLISKMSLNDLENLFSIDSIE